MEKEWKSSTRQKKILIISIITLIITLIGSTYAFFMYSKTTKAFTLTSGDINIEFVNGDNNINLTYAYPISDNYAKDNLEKLGYIDFSVNGKITEDKKVIKYEIYLEEDSKNTLDANYIKVYLTDDTNKEIVSPATFSSLEKTSYTNSENGKVIYKTFKKGEFNDKYRIYVWIDSKYSQNIVQERFSFKVNLYAYNDNETAVSVIKSNLVKYADSSKENFSGGLVAVNTDGDLYNETDTSQEIREYRYSGPSVNNYVTFNDETWRIIGVFKDEQGEEHLKIVRNEILSGIFPETYTINGISYKLKGDTENTAYWYNGEKDKSKNDWATAGLQYFFNTEHDDTETNLVGYLTYLQKESFDMIEEAKYYIGAVTFKNNGDGNLGIFDTPKEAYLNERKVSGCLENKGLETNTNSTVIEENFTCRVWSDNQATWIGKISLPYPSDYGFSTISNYWNTPLYDNSFREASNSTWMSKMPNANSWLLSSPSHSPNSSTFWLEHFVHTITSGQEFVRPTLYLKSNVKITSGDGSKEVPYYLEIE